MTEIRALTALLIVLLIASYSTWFRDDAPSVDRATLVDARLARLDVLRMQLPTSTTTLTMAKDEQGELYAWVDHDAGRRETFVGGERIDDALESLLPLRTERILGDDLPADLLAELGLTPPRGYLTLKVGETEHQFELGTRTDTDKRGDFYARRPGSPEVFLLDGRALDGIVKAEQGRQRALHSARRRDIARVEVRIGDARATIIHQNRTEPDAFWAVESDPEAKSEDADALMTSIFRITLMSYPDPEPTAESLENSAQLRLIGPDGRELSTMEFARKVGEREARRNNVYRTRSTESHRWAVLSNLLGRDILKRAAALTGAELTTATSTTPSPSP